MGLGYFNAFNNKSRWCMRAQGSPVTDRSTTAVDQWIACGNVPHSALLSENANMFFQALLC